MTREEIKQFDQLEKTIRDLTTALETNNANQNDKIEALSKKVDRSTKPLYFESDIIGSIKSSINDAIKASLTSYSGPLSNLIKSVIDDNSKELKEILTRNFVIAIRNKDFEESVKDELSRTLGRTLTKSNDALFDKISSELKNDTTFRAEVTLAMSKVVKSYLDKKG